eukprot:Sspe_Gene.25287::Locus_10144_Transcript_1_1_Confidence_1.000_Length_521::g.25287::m.25287
MWKQGCSVPASFNAQLSSSRCPPPRPLPPHSPSPPIFVVTRGERWEGGRVLWGGKGKECWGGGRGKGEIAAGGGGEGWGREKVEQVGSAIRESEAAKPKIERLGGGEKEEEEE